MRFLGTSLQGAILIEQERIVDARGAFARTWCADEMAAAGLSARVVQCNISVNTHRGTLRGMHYQAAPHAEIKIVRCSRGSIFDVIVDLRPDSATYRQWAGFELDQDNGRMLYIPAGFAHGFQALADDTEVEYRMSEQFVAEAARGVRFDDPAFGIRWPLPVTVISDRDATYPDVAP